MENSAKERRDILYDPARQEDLYRSSKAWIEALAERNGLVGDLLVLPNDPGRHPYQRLDAGFAEAFRPEPAEGVSEAEAQANILNGVRYSASHVIGEANFDNFKQELLDQTTAPGRSLSSLDSIPRGEAGSALRTLLGRLQTRNNHAALVGYHPNIIALPIYAVEFIEAARIMEEAGGRPFKMFELTEQIIMPINKSLAFAEYRGMPVVEQLALISSVSLKVPSTASSRLFGIDSGLRKAVNEQAENQFEAHLAKLDSKSKSALLVTDPTGSTAERINDDSGKLTGLRFRRITPGGLDMLDRFSFAWPVTMWWENEPRNAKWFVGHPQSIGLGKNTSRLIETLALETGRLAGAEVYFGKSQTPLGRVAVESVLDEPADSLTP
jgi:hypothetical protein